MSRRRRRKAPAAAPGHNAPMGNVPMPYFSISKNYEEQAADIYIFGDIAHNRGGFAGLLQASSDQSSYDLANQVASIPEDWTITVHINSNGGELKEGLGIYNTLKARNVTTICEGFAASAGSVIFCAGKTRIMQPASLLFIHQAQMSADGNADDFQKAAEDLRIVTSAAVEAYREAGITVDDDQLQAMLRAETWITPEEAIAYGFATQIAEPEEDEDGVIINDAMVSIMNAVKRPAVDEAPEFAIQESTLDTMEAFVDKVTEYADLFAFASKALEIIHSDPELAAKLKAVASLVLASTPAPPLGQMGNKGFLGFSK